MGYVKQGGYWLALLALGLLLGACQEQVAPDAARLTAARVRSDLLGKTVKIAGGGDFRLHNELYVDLQEQRRDGSQTLARAAVKAIDPATRSGVQGELALTYLNDGSQWLLQGIDAGKLQPMDERYAGRLAELVPFPLHFAANIGDLAGVEQALKTGTPVDLPEEKKHSTALMFAAERGFAGIVKTLAAAGATVNHQNKFGFTALHAAVSENHPEIVRFLVEKGAVIDAPDQLGQTPLYFAAERGRLELVRFLVEKGADVNRKARKNWSPLYAAATSNSLDVARFLIEHGAQVNIKTDTGTHSPLLIAAHNNNPEMVRLLLDAGADPAARLGRHHGGFRDQTALDIARQRGYTAIVEMLEKPKVQ